MLPAELWRIIAQFGSCCENKALGIATGRVFQKRCQRRDWWGTCVARLCREHVLAMDVVARGDHYIHFESVAKRDEFLAWARDHNLGRYTAHYGLKNNLLVHVNIIMLRTRLC